MIRPFAPGQRWQHDLHGGGYLYFRSSTRMNPATGRPARTLDLANIHFPEEMRGHGLFTAILVGLENGAEVFGYDALYIELVHNTRLAKFFARRPGYINVAKEYPPCFLFPIG